MALIYAYITNILVNEMATYRLKETIKTKLSSISAFPNGGTVISLLTDHFDEKFANIQRILVSNYLILYEYHEFEDFINILYIFHQTQDYAKLFQN